jgi:AcrR family transcriptional regulator
MSPKKVNKEEKRREVAISCFDLIHDVGMKNITVAQVAKTAGIGKGTVYEYFDKKEDIIFEIINMHIEEYHNEFLNSIEEVISAKEKIAHFFKFVLDDSENNMKHFNGYKEYLSIVLADENSAMKEFNCSNNDFFKEQMEKIIQNGIDNGELIPESLSLSNGLLTYEKGLALLKMSENNYDVQSDFDQFINAIFKLIEIKK